MSTPTNNLFAILYYLPGRQVLKVLEIIVLFGSIIISVEAHSILAKQHKKL